MRREMPTWVEEGISTRKRPGIEMCEEMRAPLVPIGDLATWTRISWPSTSSSSIGKSRRWGGSGSASSSEGVPFSSVPSAKNRSISLKLLW